MGDELKMTLAEIKLIKDQLNEFNSLKRQVASLSRGPTEAEMIKLKGRVDICENTDGQIRKKLTDLEKKIKMLKNTGETENAGQEVDPGALEDIITQINDLKEQLLKLEEHESQHYAEMMGEIKSKAGMSDLEDLEARLLEKITEIFKKIQSSYYPKDEVLKKLSAVNRKLREAMEQIGRAGTDIDDGMFTKKHLGPQACASCEKNLINV